jgi:hypothetical protein
MRAILAIVCTIVFFAIGVFIAFGSTGRSVSYVFLASLANYFLISHFLYSAIVFIIACMYLMCVHEGAQVDDVNEFFSLSDGYVMPALGVAMAFAVFLVIATIPGYKISWDLALGCEVWSTPCRYIGREHGIGVILFYGIGGISLPLYFLIFPFVMAVLGLLVGLTLPAFVAGVIAFSQRHPAEGTVARSVGRLRSDPAAERELLRIMDEQDASDEEVERLLGRLAPWERWYKRIEHRKRARDANRMREMAELKRRAVDEEDGLAMSVHELERARRRAEDRR